MSANADADALARGHAEDDATTSSSERTPLEGEHARAVMNALVRALEREEARRRLDAVLEQLDTTALPETQVEFLQLEWMRAATDIAQQALVPFGFVPDIEGIALTQALVELQEAARHDTVLSFQFFNLKQLFSPPLPLRTWRQTQNGSIVHASVDRRPRMAPAEPEGLVEQQASTASSSTAS